MPSFDELPLHTSVKNALYDMQFHTPSPIQHKALPVALFGSDVIGQAKSGTGKTAVFAITAVEHVLQRQEQHVCDCKESIAFAVARDPYVLIIAPTREIAVQIRSVLQQISSKCQNCVIVAVIGGLPLAHDQVQHSFFIQTNITEPILLESTLAWLSHCCGYPRKDKATY